MKKQVMVVLFAVSLCPDLLSQRPSGWKSHDMDRPRPPVVEPAPLSFSAPPPSDAEVLFDGTDLSQWRSTRGGPADWKVENGYMEVVDSAGGIQTKSLFGDVQLHAEWVAPETGSSGQTAGNSGLYLMGLYEVQVLNSYRSDTYADGQAGALYGQFPPLVNASLPPGSWQSYDIVFRRPRFDHNGRVLQPARLTVFHNGVLVQDGAELVGPTDWLQPKPYVSHPDQLPLMLQNHGSPNRFRNIWVRRLRELPEPGPASSLRPVMPLSERELARYVGNYRYERGGDLEIRVEDGVPMARLYGSKRLELVPRSETEFELRWTAATLVFELDGTGQAGAVTFHIGGEERRALRE